MLFLLVAPFSPASGLKNTWGHLICPQEFSMRMCLRAEARGNEDGLNNYLDGKHV
jgi:hypothetical protein